MEHFLLTSHPSLTRYLAGEKYQVGIPRQLPLVQSNRGVVTGVSFCSFAFCFSAMHFAFSSIAALNEECGVYKHFALDNLLGFNADAIAIKSKENNRLVAWHGLISFMQVDLLWYTLHGQQVITVGPRVLIGCSLLLIILTIV